MANRREINSRSLSRIPDVILRIHRDHTLPVRHFERHLERFLNGNLLLVKLWRECGAAAA
jgi:hypothetical protein